MSTEPRTSAGCQDCDTTCTSRCGCPGCTAPVGSGGWNANEPRHPHAPLDLDAIRERLRQYDDFPSGMQHMTSELNRRGRLRDALAGDVPALLAEVEQLRYERRLLGFARMVLDRQAEYPNLHQVDRDGLAAEAADVAQRIVDEIGHPVTDEPALGPSFRERITELERTIERVRTVATEYVEHADGCGLLAGQILDALKVAAPAEKPSDGSGVDEGTDETATPAVSEMRQVSEPVSAKPDPQCPSRLAITDGSVIRCQFYAGHTAFWPDHGVRAPLDELSHDERRRAILSRVWRSWLDGDEDCVEDSESAPRVWRLPDEPGPEVTAVRDAGDRRWIRDAKHTPWWRTEREDAMVGALRRPWTELLTWGPLTDATERCDECQGAGWVRIAGRVDGAPSGYETVTECTACNPDSSRPYAGDPAPGPLVTPPPVDRAAVIRAEAERHPLVAHEAREDGTVRYGCGCGGWRYIGMPGTEMPEHAAHVHVELGLAVAEAEAPGA